MEKIAHPFSIDNDFRDKIDIDNTLLFRLADFNKKSIIGQIAEDVPFALDIIILVESLVHIAKIPGHLNSDIKLVREHLLAVREIKKAYTQMLTNKANINKILEIYAKKSKFDLKIYETSAYDAPEIYVEKQISWTIKSKQGLLDFTQYPALNQQNTLEDPTNYCGYYAIFNAPLLSAPLYHKQFGDRDAFKKLFEIGLKEIKNYRIRSDNTGLSERDLLSISELDYSEIIDLSTTLEVKVENFDFDSNFMQHVKKEKAAKVIPNIIKQYLSVNANTDNVDRQIFIGNTSKNGSHWIAFSLEKKYGTVYINLTDSLGQNRQGLFENWFPPET